MRLLEWWEMWRVLLFAVDGNLVGEHCQVFCCVEETNDVHLVESQVQMFWM